MTKNELRRFGNVLKDLRTQYKFFVHLARHGKSDPNAIARWAGQADAYWTAIDALDRAMKEARKHAPSP